MGLKQRLQEREALAIKMAQDFLRKAGNVGDALILAEDTLRQTDSWLKGRIFQILWKTQNG